MIIEYESASETTTTVVAQSDMDGDIDSLVIPMSREDFCEAVMKWSNGELLHVAFPKLNAGEREFLKTGITPAKWDAMFNCD